MSDRYTKIVLTVIAAALVGLLAQNAIRPLSAESSGLQRVMICDSVNPRVCARLWHYAGSDSILPVIALPK